MEKQIPTELDAVKEAYRYNSYVQKKYIDALEKLPPEELLKDRGASHPSMFDIFVHTIGAYVYWFLVQYPGIPKEKLDAMKDPTTLGEARVMVTEVNAFVMNFVEGLDEEGFEKSFEGKMSGERWSIPVKYMLWHLVEEELQHRGELNALFWQMNIDPPITDWIDWKMETGVLKKVP